MHDTMEHKAVIVAIIVLCSSWIAYSDVDCSEKGSFIDPADSTCRTYVTCTFNVTISSYTLIIDTCDTNEIFDVKSQSCVSSNTNICSVSLSHNRRSRAISADAITDVSLTDATTESTSGLTPQTTELTTEIGETTISSTEHEISASTSYTTDFTTEAISTTAASTGTITTEETTTVTEPTTVTTETTELTSEATSDPTTEPVSTTTELFTDTTTVTTDITTIESVTTVPTMTTTVITTETTTLITDTTTTELPTTTPTLSPDNFVCTSAGRFSDETDDSCRTYYLCVLSSTGIFATYKYICPSGSAFSPTSRVCSVSYACPKTSTSTSSSTTTSTTTTSTTSTTTTTTTESPISFACTAAGRFSDPSDNTCGSYYLCISSVGSFISYKYTCPSGSYFSPASRVCTTSYTCPKR